MAGTWMDTYTPEQIYTEYGTEERAPSWWAGAGYYGQNPDVFYQGEYGNETRPGGYTYYGTQDPSTAVNASSLGTTNQAPFYENIGATGQYQYSAGQGWTPISDQTANDLYGTSGYEYGTRDSILNSMLKNAGVSMDQWTQQLGSLGYNDPYQFLNQGVQGQMTDFGRVTEGSGTARNELSPYLSMLEAAGYDWRSNPTLSGAYTQAQDAATQQAQSIDQVNSQGIELQDLLMAAASVWGGGYLMGTGLGAAQGLGSFSELLMNPSLTGVNLTGDLSGVGGALGGVESGAGYDFGMTGMEGGTGSNSLGLSDLANLPTSDPSQLYGQAQDLAGTVYDPALNTGTGAFDMAGSTGTGIPGSGSAGQSTLSSILSQLQSIPGGSTLLQQLGGSLFGGGTGGTGSTGGGGMNDLTNLVNSLFAVNSSNDQTDFLKNLLAQGMASGDPFKPHRAESGNLLMQSYNDPLSIWNKPEYQALDKKMQDTQMARDAAGGQLFNAPERLAQRSTGFLEQLDKYRQPLLPMSGASFNPASDLGFMAAMAKPIMESGKSTSAQTGSAIQSGSNILSSILGGATGGGSTGGGGWDLSALTNLFSGSGTGGSTGTNFWDMWNI